MSKIFVFFTKVPEDCSNETVDRELNSTLYSMQKSKEKNHLLIDFIELISKSINTNKAAIIKPHK